MPASLVLLLLLTLLAVSVAVIFIASYLNSPRRTEGPTRNEKQLEKLVGEIRELAYNRRDTDSALSYEITDKIAEFYKPSDLS